MTDKVSAVLRTVVAMPTIVRDTPNGLDWGFYTREDPRMHLQVVAPKNVHHKVWLENKGKRVFEPEGKVSASVLNPLRSYLKDHLFEVESEWANLLWETQWFKLKFVGNGVHAIVYPGTHQEFRRVVNLAVEFPNGYQDMLAGSVTFNLKTSAIEVWPKRDGALCRDWTASGFLWV